MKTHFPLTGLLALAALSSLSACSRSGAGFETPAIAFNALENPTIAVTGSAVTTVGGTTYLLADSTGLVALSGNLIAATFSDPATPILTSANTGVFWDEVVSGSCNLDILFATQSDPSGDNLTTQIDANSCNDRTVIGVVLDTSQLGDSAGNVGDNSIEFNLTVDVAPKVATVAAGNPSATGNGAADTPNVYKTATDNSLIVTFSKGLSGGTISATLTAATSHSCGATLASSTLLGGNDATVVWTLGGAPAPGDVCVLNVAGIADAAGNPEDPNDPNLNMTVTFQ